MGPGSQSFLVLLRSPPSWSNWLDRMIEWPFEDLVIAPVRCQYLSGLEQGFPEGCVCSELVFNI